jgi:hypothetical protein
MSNDLYPYYEDADRVTVGCVEAVKGKRFIAPAENMLSGPGMPAAAQVGASDPVDGANIMAAHCPAGAKALGVSTWDEVAGGKTGCISEGIVPVTAGENLAAGQSVAAGPNGVAVAVSATGTAATLEFGASNAIIKLVQIIAGAAKVKIILKVSGNNTPLSVTAAGEVITVNVATNGSGEATSTATEVINAINSTEASNAKVQAANGGASTGAGVVAALAETPLAGGAAQAEKNGLCLTGVTSGNDAMIKLHC